MKKIILIALPIVFSLGSCTPEVEFEDVSQGSSDVSKVIYVGDGLMGGYTNGAINDQTQEKSIAHILSLSFSEASGKDAVHPLITASNGIGYNYKPWVSDFVEFSVMGDRTDCEGTVSLGPVKTEYNYTSTGDYVNYNGDKNKITDFSIPFLSTSEYNSVTAGNDFPNGGNLFLHRILNNSGNNTYLDAVENAQSSFTVAWVGLENILKHARNGGEYFSIPSATEFERQLDSLIDRSSLKLGQGVLINIPALKLFPYFTTIPWDGLDIDQQTADTLNSVTGGFFNFQAGKNGFVIKDKSTGAYRKMVEGEYLTLVVHLDSMKCERMGVVSNVPDNFVLDTSEVNHITSMIDQYNQIIQAKATQYNLAYMDANDYFEQVSNGIKWNGVDFNIEFVSGGFFGLDGLHPTEKGYDLLANEIILSINAKYNANFPLIQCVECSGVLFP